MRESTAGPEAQEYVEGRGVWPENEARVPHLKCIAAHSSQLKHTALLNTDSSRHMTGVHKMGHYISFIDHRNNGST